MAQNPAIMPTVPIAQRNRYRGSLLDFRIPGPCRKNSGKVNSNPKKLRKKAISKGCWVSDARRMTTAIRPNNTVTGQYAKEDANMDGTVKYTGSTNDRDPILVNVGSTTPNNTRTEQVP